MNHENTPQSQYLKAIFDKMNVRLSGIQKRKVELLSLTKETFKNVKISKIKDSIINQQNVAKL